MVPTTQSPQTFAAKIYEKLTETRADQNMVLSPFSIDVALAMCAAGAKGETRHVLTDLLGAPHDVAQQNRRYAGQLASLNALDDGEVLLTTANALWVQQGERLQPEYLKAVADCYRGILAELDFQNSPDQAVNAINTWIKRETSGKITELVQRQNLTPDTRLILTNAIYFKGKWASEFDSSRTTEEDWFGAGTPGKVAMMQKRDNFLFYECADFQALDIAYQGEQLSLLVILPTKPDGLTAMEKRWANGDTYRQVTQSLGEAEIIVSLPRFKIESEFELKPALCELGADIVFSDNADFSGISPQRLKIAEVVHKAFIEVNEEGTEAAGATGVMMAKCAVMADPKYFIADHPFLFVIRDRATNSVLFTGRVMKP